MPRCSTSEKHSLSQCTHHSHQRHPNKPETGRMTRGCKSLNPTERVQSGSQPAGTELPEALLTVSVSLVLSTIRCAISWAMWPDPKNISNLKVEPCHKIKVMNQRNYSWTFFPLWVFDVRLEIAEEHEQKTHWQDKTKSRHHFLLESEPLTVCKDGQSLWKRPSVWEDLLSSPEVIPEVSNDWSITTAPSAVDALLPFPWLLSLE